MSIQGISQDGEGTISNLETKDLLFDVQNVKVNENINYLLSGTCSLLGNSQIVVKPQQESQDGVASRVSCELDGTTPSSDGAGPGRKMEPRPESPDDYQCTPNAQSSSELDARRVEEWLKGKNDSMIFECDEGDMGIFDGDSCEILSPKINLSVEEEVGRLALGLPSGVSGNEVIKLTSDPCNELITEITSVECTPDIPVSGEIDEPPESYIDILVKTQNGDKFIRVKSSFDFEASLSENLTNLLSEPNNPLEDSFNQALVQLGEHTPGTMSQVTNNLNEPEINLRQIGIVNNKTQTIVLPQTYTIPESRSKPKIFKCTLEGCEQTFTKETKLKVHLMTHEETRQFKCTHDGCDWCFTSAYRLKRHLACHTEQKGFLCDEPGCKRRFTTIYNLNTHKSLHKRPSLIECLHPDCEERFPTRRQMEFHFKNHDDVEAPYLCPILACGKRFYSSTFLSSHLRVHQFSADDLTCPIPECKKRYTRVCQLRQHMRGHTGERPFVCTYEGCYWTFMTASRLTRHMRKHTGERKYVCPEPGCEKSFMRPEHLKGHVIAHAALNNGDKPFKCPIENCTAAFTAKSSVYVHLKKHHTNELTLYPCPIEGCSRRYRSKTSLKKHLMNCHATPVDSINSLAMVPVVEVIKSPEMQANELNNRHNTLMNQIDYILPNDVEDNVISEVNVQESSLILPQEIMEQDIIQNDKDDVLINSIIGNEDLSMSNNQSSIEQIVSQISTENEGSSRCTSPEGSLLSRRSSVVGAGSEMDTLILPPLPEVNKGGSARTDFCSNAILSARARKRRLFRQQLENGESNEQIGTRVKDQLLPAGMLSSMSDVFLASSSISFMDQSGRTPLLHSQLLQDDPPVVPSEIYSDNILDAISTELANPLLSEPCSSTSNVFPVTVMNLNDLE